MDIEYNDEVTVVITGVDDYGSEIFDQEATVAAAVELGTGTGRSRNQAAITSDARVYLDPTDEFVQDQCYRLEGALLIIQLFGSELRQSWYRVVNVEVARDTQLSNQIDNVLLRLNKTVGIEGVS